MIVQRWMYGMIRKDEGTNDRLQEKSLRGDWSDTVMRREEMMNTHRGKY